MHVWEFLTSSDVSKLGGGNPTPAAVRAAANAGRLPVAATTPGGVRLFRREAVLRFLKERAERKEHREQSMVESAK